MAQRINKTFDIIGVSLERAFRDHEITEPPQRIRQKLGTWFNVRMRHSSGIGKVVGANVLQHSHGGTWFASVDIDDLDGSLVSLEVEGDAIREFDVGARVKQLVDAAFENWVLNPPAPAPVPAAPDPAAAVAYVKAEIGHVEPTPVANPNPHQARIDELCGQRGVFAGLLDMCGCGSKEFAAAAKVLAKRYPERKYKCPAETTLRKKSSAEYDLQPTDLDLVRGLLAQIESGDVDGFPQGMKDIVSARELLRLIATD